MTDSVMKSFEDATGVSFGNTFHDVPETTLAALLAEHFVTTPDAPALTFGDTTLTYGELDAKTAALAAELAARGVGPERFVAISLRRSLELIVAILATIRAGGAYVPLNPDDPDARRADIMGECEPVVLLAEEACGPTPLLASADWPETGDCPDPEIVAPTNLAYAMYTSGSTGKPKGVMIEHRAIINRLLWMRETYGFTPEDRVLQKTPVTFDVSLWELFTSFLSGGHLVVAPDGAHRDPREILSLIRKHDITRIHFIPTMLSLFLDVVEDEGLEIPWVYCSGEALRPDLRDRFHRIVKAELHNLYGPTEASVEVSYWDASAHDDANPMPIGYPVWNTRLYVLDDDGQLLPPGQKGRLWLAGRQVARGYLNRDDLTAERFVDDPFVPGERMYDSGDIAETRADGAVIYHGRADTQIKIRGIRLELGEVEAALEAQPGINQAVVVARDDLGGGELRLAAFCTGGPVDEAALRAELADHLPAHAVPSRIIAIDALPFGSAGKVDRRALTERKIEARTKAKAPRKAGGDTARVIAGELAKLLDVAGPDIDRGANFFDLGATSLQLVHLREALLKTEGLEFPVSDFFLYTSVDALAAHLDGTDSKPAARVKAAKEAKSDLIAIVGMAGRFPGANSVDEFWQGLVEGREMISHFSEDELDFDPRKTNPGTDYVLSRGVMQDPEMFDAKHFGIPPREADRLDPQHRIMLEVAQTALENAGHDPDRFPGKIGIFCGASQSSYLLNNLLSTPGAARELAAGYPVKDFATAFGNDKDFLATRLAYKLNLKGPAMTVQTACSTALTAVAQACTALQTGQADMVLAGAVSVTFPTKRPYAYLSEGMASADGHCRTFDAQASGTVFGDGAGVVALRRLEDALEDGDEVIAVIRGVGINNDGADKAGYAAPSIRAQTEAIEAAHQAAGINPREVGYIEAHGTATPLGDPIEFTALQAAFGASTEDRQFCAIGSAKTNIGHLDMAAGAAGLIKAALVLKHGQIPPLLHYTAPNPRIDFEASAFYPATELTDWTRGETARIAGVSAFGVGGTNVHLVLEEAPEVETPARPEDGDALRVFPVSGTSPDAVAAGIAELGAFAAANPDADPDRVIATLRHGRRQYAQRSVLVARDMGDLARVAEGFKGKPAKAATRSQLAFLFPGQGAQHVGMGQHLFENAPVFREALSICAELLEPELGLNLLEVIHAPEDQAEEMTERLRDTALAQPAIFSMSYALAKQWDHWGISPDAMVGHSIGEFAAATLAGVMDLPDALKLIALRGRLMADLPRGVMISVRASEDEVAPYLGAGLDLAAVNGAKAVVLAGPEEAAEAILPKLEADGFVATRLHTSHAFHSHMMEPALAPFEAAVAKLTLRAPQVPILSTVTGDWLTDDEATSAAYWAGHMRRPVRFYDAMQILWAEGQHMFLESGPGRTLSTLAAQNPERGRAQPALASLPHATAEDADSHVSMLDSFGQLWACGYAIDWTRIDESRPEALRLAGLPTYPFQRTKHWVEPAEITDTPAEAEVAPETEVETAPLQPADAGTAVRDMLSDLSGVDPADMDGEASFLELGFDSLMLTQAMREISDRFEVTVTLRELMDSLANIDALAAHIEANGSLAGGAPDDKTKVGWMAEMERPEPAAEAKPAPEPAPKAEQSSAPVTKITRDTDEIRPEQQAQIDQLVARFNARTPKSKALTQEYRPYHADPRTASGFNRHWKEAVYQIVSERSKGSRFLDVDGNEYVDLLNGFGPGFLGHTNPLINDAIAERMARGYEVGPQHLEAMEAAKLFCEVTGNERASFVCTGSEAVYAAMRLSRTVTNRDTIVIFQRDYHGNFDEVLVRGIDGAGGPRSLPVAPGIPRDAVKNIVVLPYGTPEALDWIRKNANTLAAVVIEPVQSRRPEFRPIEFVREVRRITERAGALMVFDEVVTGFRFGPRGAQAYFGIEADLVTYGKIVGAEMPVGVVAGKARYMDTFDGGQWQYGDDSFPEAPVTFFAGTFVRHPLTMAAVRAMLQHLKAQPALFWQTINAKGDRLAGTVNRWFRDNDMPFELPNCGSLMYLRIGEDQKFGGLLGVHLRTRGLFLLEGFPSYVTAAHDDEDIDFAIEVYKDAALEMRAGGLLTGREAVAYDGPHVLTAPPRLSLPGGAEQIEAAMAEPVRELKVPTTAAQQELWAAQLLEPELAAGYNENYAIELRGPGIDTARLEEAVREACTRHDALTALFSSDGTEMIVGATQPEIARLDVSGEADPDAAVAAIWKDAASRPFDLEAGPLAYFRIVQRGPEAVDLMITAHHIVFDGWSGGTMLRDICRLYDAKMKGTVADLPEISSPYDYSRAESDWMESEAGKAATTYWTDLFSDMPTAVTLPSNALRGAVRDVAAAREDITIPAETVAALRKAATGMGVTLFSLLFAGFKLFVARSASAPDVTVAVPSAGQPVYQLENLVFHCVNTMPVRSALAPDEAFRAFVKRVSSNVFDASEHQQLTYGSIVRALNVPRDASQTPLTSMMFNLDPAFSDAELDFAGVRANYHSVPRLFSNFEIDLNLSDKGDVIVAEWTYQTALFDTARITGFMEDFLALLDRASAQPDATLDTLLAASDDDMQLLADISSGPAMEIPEAPLNALVAEQARLHAGKTAIEATGSSLSYGDLDTLSNRLAQTLIAKGITRGDIVGIALQRSPSAIVGLLGVLKAGAAYLPLDPNLPEDRLRYMVEDSGAKIVLVDDHSPSVFEGADVLMLDEETLSENDSDPGVTIAPSDLAYILYTSGSTGKPKGVSISHRAFVNFIASMAKAPGLRADQRVLAVTTFSFDIAGLEIWGPLTQGGTVVLANSDEVLDVAALTAKIDSCDLMQATPATYHLLLQGGWTGKSDLTVLIGGEPVPQDMAATLVGSCAEVWNMYGPTETTVWSTIDRMDGKRVRVGRPIANTDLRIVDPDSLKPKPPGAVGELLIGGDGLAQGYHNRPDLTAERFVSLTENGNKARYYRTGDLARFVQDGANWSLDVLGRADGQIKLRGYRIEIGEIEAALSAIDGVSRAAVIVQDEGSPAAYLAAAVVSDTGQEVAEATLRQTLGESLPAYMVPTLFQTVEAMPLNTSGKIDRRALKGLLQAAAPTPGAATDADLTDDERQLLEIWQRHFPGREVGPDDGFFDIGGHSLMAVTLFDNIRKEMGHALPISMLLHHQTPRALVQALKAAEAPSGEPGSAPDQAEDALVAQTLTSMAKQELLHVVPLTETKSDRPPLFLVAGMFGNVMHMRHLAQSLGQDRSLYGLQLRGVFGDYEPHHSLEEAARDYIAEMRQIQPKGPYFIGGYSGGAVTALEMARQLEEAGEEVAQVFLLDILTPKLTRAHKIKLHLAHLKAEKHAYVARWFQRQSEGKRRLEEDALTKNMAVGRAFTEAVERYQPTRWEGPVTLFRPPVERVWEVEPGVWTDANHYYAANDNMWGQHLPNLDIVEIDGQHVSMMLEPDVLRLADAMKFVLAETEKRLGLQSPNTPGS